MSGHQPRRLTWSRREMLRTVLGTSASVVPVLGGVGCGGQGESGVLGQFWSGQLPPEGDLLSPDFATGHRLRGDGLAKPDQGPGADRANTVEPMSRHRCVIVGAGVAGLSAAWHLKTAGLNDFVVLELEEHAGGTSRSGKLGDFQFPWGAHYLPVPSEMNVPLIAFLREIGVVTSGLDQPIEIDERYLCRDPEERVFAGGRWRHGLYPSEIASDDDFQELDRFQAEIILLSQQRGNDGLAWFAIPTRLCSGDAQARRLAKISMAQWMDEKGFHSKPLRWLVDYSCRDDYGLRSDQASAWAGLFYFAARIKADGSSQEVMTWPNGNGFLISEMLKRVGDHVQTRKAVMGIRQSRTHLSLDVLDCDRQTTSTIEADRIVLATPQFITNRILPPDLVPAPNSGRSNTYGSWLVANVHLTSRPDENDCEMSWDNVLMNSDSLGYVSATHQLGSDHGPTVLTWYQALPSDVPVEVRKRLLGLTWADAAEIVMSDVEQAHPDIRSLASRVDVMLWGHAMVQPVVGYPLASAAPAAGDQNQVAASRIQLANTDLSSMALFEEAFDHGRAAALEVAKPL